MGFVGVVVQVQLMILVVTGMIILATIAAADQLGLPGCETKCGDVDIPYPFGMTKGCYLDTKFHVKCNNSKTLVPTPILSKNLFLKNISIEGHEINIMVYIARKCYKESGELIYNNLPWLKVPSFTISNTKNKFVVIGCDSYGYLYDYENNSMGCSSICQSIDKVPNDGSCSGIGCCQIEIPKGLKNISVEVRSFNNHTRINNFNKCSYAFLAEDKKFKFSRQYLNNFSDDMVPMVLEWAIDNDTCLQGQKQPFCPCGKNSERQYLINRSYYCKCKPGYYGNPYLLDGCQDVNECQNSTHKCDDDENCVNTEGSYICNKKEKDEFLVIEVAIGISIGFAALVGSSSWLLLILRKRKLVKLKERFFQQNGGIILQQRLSQQEDLSITAKIFTEAELRNATNNYDENAIVGRGGYGTVYKGVLLDNTVVAIKKSKFVDQSQMVQFINEIVVLSQINHRNILKLLGCCLETEVPLLVYEFVPNGTLFEHIHNKSKASNLNFETRLVIAAETAGALSYLHSSASTPIFHRDVKSSNILLDNYTAKVSDFGTSRLVPIDQTELATMVQGTLGYLDPEYLHTNQLTDKSDVYSFGVVLVELLTAQKAVSFARPEEDRSLAMYFLSSLKDGTIFEVIESHLVEEGKKEKLLEMTEIAKRCLNVRGDDRPTMKEVAMELEGLRKIDKHPWVKGEHNMEETQHLLGHTCSAYQNNDGSHTIAMYDSILSSEFTGR